MNTVKRISFSELKNWKECPYRHKLIYVDNIPHFEGNEYTAFGTAIHTVCEKTIPGEEKDPLKVFSVAFDEQIEILKQQNVTLDSKLVD